MKVRVVRPLHYAGVRKEIGEILDLPDGRALEAVSTGRAERVEAAKPPSGPMTTKSVVTDDPPAPAVKPEEAEKPAAARKKGAPKDVGQ